MKSRTTRFFLIQALERLRAQLLADDAMDAGDPPKFSPHAYPRDF